MRIVLVTEFGQDDYFQWRWIWNMDAQIKRNVIVDTTIINPSVLSLHNDNSKYWRFLNNADLVFVYSSRTLEPNFPYNRDGIQYYWNWWELPKIARRYMRPEAKLIAQNDDDWIWLQKPEWVWWEDAPNNYGSPEQFFKNTGILEVPDIWFTVLENPYWKKFTNKPVKYMPLPHLWRYGNEISKANMEYETKGIDMHQQSIALMRHSSRVASINKLVREVAEKVNIPITYFSTQWSEPRLPIFNVPIKTYLYLGREEYMERLRTECIVAIDDADNYVGWSRFVMECALNYIPCIGSNFANKLFFPELYTDHRDFSKQVELIKLLFNNKDFYKSTVEKAHYEVVTHLNSDRLADEIVRIGKYELKVVPLPINIEMELLRNILYKSLPFSIIPSKPSENQNIWDDIHHRQCDTAQWMEWYGVFEKFISDEAEYRKIIQEVLNSK